MWNTTLLGSLYIYFLFHVGVIACFVFLLSSDADGRLSAGTAGRVSKREPAKVLSSRSTTHPWGYQHCSFSSCHQNDAPPVALVPTCSTLVLILHPSPLLTSLRHLRVNRHLPWIACVRVKAWAGHRPLPGNCSHLDSLQFISCDFFFFFFTLELFFFIWTRDGCTRSRQAWQEVDESKAGGSEKGRQAFLLSSFWLFLPWKIWFFYLPLFALLLQKSPTFGFYWCPFVFARWLWDVKVLFTWAVAFFEKKKSRMCFLLLLLLSVFPLAPLPHIF